MSRIQSLIDRIHGIANAIGDARSTARVYIDSIIGSMPTDASRIAPSTPTTLNEAVDQLDEELQKLQHEYNRLGEEAAPRGTQLGQRRT